MMISRHESVTKMKHYESLVFIEIVNTRSTNYQSEQPPLTSITEHRKRPLRFPLEIRFDSGQVHTCDGLKP